MSKGKSKKSSQKSSSKTSPKTPMDINKMSNENVIKFIKSLDMTPIYMVLGFNLIVILYISSIIYYLNKLQVCSCYNEINENNSSNLTYLVVIEAIILTITIISTIVILVTIYTIRNIKQKGGRQQLGLLAIVFLIINLGITIYFVYNVYKLSQNVKPDCECTKSWLRYLLYIQSVFMIIGIIGNGVLLGKTIMNK